MSADITSGKWYHEDLVRETTTARWRSTLQDSRMYHARPADTGVARGQGHGAVHSISVGEVVFSATTPFQKAR